MTTGSGGEGKKGEGGQLRRRTRSRKFSIYVAHEEERSTLSWQRNLDGGGTPEGVKKSTTKEKNTCAVGRLKKERYKALMSTLSSFFQRLETH